MEGCDLSNKEFNVAIMKKLHKIQENFERHFNELKRKTNEQKEYFA